MRSSRLMKTPIDGVYIELNRMRGGRYPTSWDFCRAIRRERDAVDGVAYIVVTEIDGIPFDARVYAPGLAVILSLLSAGLDSYRAYELQNATFEIDGSMRGIRSYCSVTVPYDPLRGIRDDSPVKITQDMVEFHLSCLLDFLKKADEEYRYLAGIQENLDYTQRFVRAEDGTPLREGPLILPNTVGRNKTKWDKFEENLDKTVNDNG